MATQPHSPRNPDGNGRRNPREIQSDIEQTRCEMDETINKLSERLSPQHLMDMAYDYFRSSTGVSRSDMAHGAKSAARMCAREIQRHPVPSMLIGAGLLYALFVEDDDTKREFHSQWADIPEYSGSFVDARTGQPYDLENYGREWSQEAAAWRPGYNWSKSRVSEQTWTEMAKHALAEIRSLLSDASTSAGERLRHIASRLRDLSGHDRRAMRSRWANLRSHGGSWMDLQSNEPYDATQGQDWQAMNACDYWASYQWTPEEEATWSERAQHALEEMQEIFKDTGRSAKEQLQTAAAKIGDFVGSTRDFSAGAGRAFYSRASDAGRSMGRGARYVGRKTRRGGEMVQEQLRQGYDYSRQAAGDAMDEYPLAAGAAVLGIGLLLGFALPRTRYEDRMLGDRSDRIKRQARETGRQAVERAKHVAQATANAALEEAEQQGLAPQQMAERVRHAAEEVKHSVQDNVSGESVQTLSEKVAAIAERAASTAKEEIQKEGDEMRS